jgi:hypothetical protein
VGELLVGVKKDGAILVEFSKPPFTVASAQAFAGGWTVERPLERRRMSGRGRPPGHNVWFALAGALGASGVDGRAWRFQPLGNGTWRLVHPVTGERLEGFLSP